MHKLMIVDDELLMRIGIRSMINWEVYGFQIVAESTNGKEALEVAKSMKPDLIITDIKMPVMDGLQFIREASKALAYCKYVIVSNFDEFGYVKEALRLGAIDYLIKSEITPETLIELLTTFSSKSEVHHGALYPSIIKADLSQSLTHLKESFFKDLISGLLDEKDAISKSQQLQIAVESQPLVVMKLRIDQFTVVRRKYVEKDEKLLRFSVVNILEEIIPRKWNKEIVVESSSEYLIIANLPLETEDIIETDIRKLCNNIQRTIKDFMNMSISIGISSFVESFRNVRMAYHEADQALRYRFFLGSGHILFYHDVKGDMSFLKDFDEGSKGEIHNQTDAANQLHVVNEMNLSFACDSNKLTAYFDSFRMDLNHRQANEKMIREAYIRLTESISTCMPANYQKTVALPYEALFTAETWDEVHQIVFDYAEKCLLSDCKNPEQRSYTEMAVEFINRYYSENISLQSVANQINVNPSYLSRLFKQEMGENFVAYVTRVRIERAKSFLENSHYKIYEIADKVGYHNYTYFSKIFKKVVGVSPEEYRG
ncbi:helix-turn-helix domain-containing protein [Paenibacillus septentrionalis]|uniref:Helix-turn-helix domain-containing protein n=1 Tax=Paenibacillus septentrionalis TaxID=429342 RepID=A0ABW1VA85_9BACL